MHGICAHASIEHRKGIENNFYCSHTYKLNVQIENNNEELKYHDILVQIELLDSKTLIPATQDTVLSRPHTIIFFHDSMPLDPFEMKFRFLRTNNRLKKSKRSQKFTFAADYTFAFDMKKNGMLGHYSSINSRTSTGVNTAYNQASVSISYNNAIHVNEDVEDLAFRRYILRVKVYKIVHDQSCIERLVDQCHIAVRTVQNNNNTRVIKSLKKEYEQINLNTMGIQLCTSLLSTSFQVLSRKK